MKALLMVLALAACKHTPTTTPEDSHHAAAVLATTTSPPRADWPSALTQYSTDDGQHTTYRFVYGSDAPCKASVVAQSFAIVGCPTTAERTSSIEKPETVTFTYDAARHLTHDNVYSYQWQGDVVVGQGDGFTYDLADGNLVVSIREGKDKTVHALYRVDHGHLMAELEARVDAEGHVSAGSPSGEYVWRGNRLIEITERGFHSYVEYPGDPPHAPRAEDVARAKALAADHDAAALATTTSLPRQDWPCTAVRTVGTERPIKRTFTYDPARSTCQLPLEAQALGVVGCPTGGSEEETTADGHIETTPLVFGYTDDRLEWAYDNRYWWREDKVFGGTGNSRGRFERHDGGVSQLGIGGGPTTSLEIVDGKLDAFEAHTGNTTKAKLVWTKHRLTKIDETIDHKDDNPPTTVTTVLGYDCKPAK